MKKALFALIFLLTVRGFSDDFVIDEPNGSQAVRNPVPSVPGFNRLISIGSVPTPNSPAKGKFYGDCIMYDGGGVNVRLIVGIFDFLGIGITENIDGLIGSESVNLNIPGAYVKATLIKDWNHFNLALGFDNFAYGKNGSFLVTNSRPYSMYGFFATGGWHYSVFGGNDEFSFGLRIPLLPNEFRDITNTSLFLGMTASFPSFLSFGFTIENFYLTMNRFDQLLPSFIVTFAPAQQFKVSIILQYEIYTQRLNRILSLGYEELF
jgi:hypothetical protein